MMMMLFLDEYLLGLLCKKLFSNQFPFLMQKQGNEMIASLFTSIANQGVVLFILYVKIED